MVILLVLLLAILLLCGLVVFAINEIRRQGSRFTIFEQQCPVECASTRSSGNKRGACHVTAPPLFSGNTGEFKEWVFAMDFALETLTFEDVEESVDHAASFLQGNARLWFIASQETSIQFLDWPPLRTTLGGLYGLLHDKEQARICLSSAQECGELESYVNEFSRLSLSVPQLDKHSRTVLFAKGQAQK